MRATASCRQPLEFRGLTLRAKYIACENHDKNLVASGMPKSKCMGGRWGHKVQGKTPGLGGGFSTSADVGSGSYNILQYINIFLVCSDSKII